MTITLSKFKLAISIVVVALIVPTAAIASDAWSDVEEGRFYHDAVTWAKANGMTTGCNDGTGFCPNDGVTRGENITFAKRYDDFVVQPALTEINADIADNTSDIADNTSDIADNTGDIAALPVMLWATVAPAGDSPLIVRGRGAESVTKVTTGYYSVTFERDVTDCTWVATYGEPDSSGVDAAYATVRGGPTAQEARVVIRDSSGTQVDGDGFHLMVVCEPDDGLIVALSTPDASAPDSNIIGD